MKRFKHVLFHLMIYSLCAASCTSSSSNPHAAPTRDIIVVTSTPVITATATLETPKESNLPTAEIDARMAKLVDSIPLAGLAMAIDYKGETYQRGYGLADFEAKQPVSPQTVFQIASLTKSFTAAAILRLSEEGKLHLEDPISRFFPRVPEAAKDIRVQNLLNHTSGLPDVSMDAAQAALPDPFTTAQAVEQYFSKVQNLEFAPGTVSSYNNTGYFMLGAIIENVTGMSYYEYLDGAFFQPLSLTSTGECALSSESEALGYHSVNKQLERADPADLKFAGAAGALCSTAGDLLIWLNALVDGRVLQPQTWQQMITQTKLSDGQAVEYGFGLVVEADTHGPEISHDGAIAGFNSFFIYYPDHDLSVVLLANTDGFDPSLRGIASSLVTNLLRE